MINPWKLARAGIRQDYLRVARAFPLSPFRSCWEVCNRSTESLGRLHPQQLSERWAKPERGTEVERARPPLPLRDPQRKLMPGWTCVPRRTPGIVCFLWSRREVGEGRRASSTPTPLPARFLEPREPHRRRVLGSRFQVLRAGRVRGEQVARAPPLPLRDPQRKLMPGWTNSPRSDPGHRLFPLVP